MNLIWFDSFFFTGTPSGNISLDNRFCDRDVTSNRLNDCVQGLGYNTSLTIPISRHFRDPYVNLVFQEPTENSGIVMCTVDSRSLTYCDQAHEDTDLSAVTESGISDTNNSYHVHVGIFRSIHVKFRMIKRFARDPMQARRNLCRLSDNKLGAIYEEINLRFYRSCDSWFTFYMFFCFSYIFSYHKVVTYIHALFYIPINHRNSFLCISFQIHLASNKITIRNRKYLLELLTIDLIWIKLSYFKFVFKPATIFANCLITNLVPSIQNSISDLKDFVFISHSCVFFKIFYLQTKFWWE